MEQEQISNYDKLKEFIKKEKNIETLRIALLEMLDNGNGETEIEYQLRYNFNNY